jgi:hypothetical protein
VVIPAAHARLTLIRWMLLCLELHDLEGQEQVCRQPQTIVVKERDLPHLIRIKFQIPFRHSHQHGATYTKIWSCLLASVTSIGVHRDPDDLVVKENRGPLINHLRLS